jgi:GT2 family glycosyltransferase
LAAADAIGVVAPRGLTRQRNSILEHSKGCDILVFFDDDFLAQARYLECIERVFLARPDVVMVTGQVLADGITGPGLSTLEALRVLDNRTAETGSKTGDLMEVYNGYGCNMAVRLCALQAGSLTFDEALPLYGWLEDVDFSRRLAPYGRIVRCELACGVHLGVKAGRQSGSRLGYSQIANPVYLAQKGTLAAHRAARQIARNVGMNVARSLWPEPYVDRRGRLWGNILGAVDLMMRKLEPKGVLRIGENASSFRD